MITPEQRDWILDNVKRTGRYGSYISYFELKELLTANTEPEDEGITQQDLINVRMACDNALMDNYQMGYDRCNIQRGTDEEITQRKIDEFWYEKYSDVPLDGMLRKFVNWLQEDK